MKKLTLSCPKEAHLALDSDKKAICAVLKSCGLTCEMYDANGEIYGWVLLRIKPQDTAKTAMW